MTAFEDAYADDCSNGIKIPVGSTIAVQRHQLNDQEKTTFINLLGGLICERRKVYEKPEIFALITTPPSAESQILNIYLREGYILLGEYLDAWTERMEGKASKVYLLDAKAKDFLTKLSAEGRGNKSTRKD